jgi:hypothetical protein
MDIHFDSIRLVITDRDKESASVKVEFDPPMPEEATKGDFESNLQPCTVLAFMLLKELETNFSETKEEVGDIPQAWADQTSGTIQ